MKRRVLFLCTGNSCRSQMAEGLLRHLAGERFEVESAGTRPTGLNSDAVEAMREIGIDISRHASQGIGGVVKQPFRYVITLCDHAKEDCPVFPGEAEHRHWSFEDPATASGSPSERKTVFRRVRDEIAAKLREFLKEVP